MTKKNSRTRRILVLLAAAAVLCGVYLHYENTALVTTCHTVSAERLPPAFDGFRIAQVSDLHNTGSARLVQRLVTELRQQAPDIIALTGDLIDARRTDIDAAIRFIEQIRDIAPVYYVTGNHEASVSAYPTLANRLEENGVVILDNRTQVLTRGSGSVSLIGVHDPHMAHESFVPDAEIMAAQLRIAGYDRTLYSILLSHRPELLHIYAAGGIDLVLSGHAHGGQIRLPLVGGLVAPDQGLFPAYTAGLYREGGTTMAVSRGIGNSILPFRINNRPELVVLTLAAG
ncbi:MAG: metallophosphoesterase [Ruminococcaceae bacterium]|nr:metallophosphoesterase [Oscillospiraceae bacterium]